MNFLNGTVQMSKSRNCAMRKIIFFTTSFFSIVLHACPICVGKVTTQTVPFFDQEFYKPGKKSDSTPNIAIEYGKKKFQRLIDESKGKK